MHIHKIRSYELSLFWNSLLDKEMISQDVHNCFCPHLILSFVLFARSTLSGSHCLLHSGACPLWLACCMKALNCKGTYSIEILFSIFIRYYTGTWPCTALSRCFTLTFEVTNTSCHLVSSSSKYNPCDGLAFRMNLMYCSLKKGLGECNGCRSALFLIEPSVYAHKL